MPITHEGSHSLALLYLRATLAASARFQSLVSADDATEAAESIYDFEALDDGAEEPPRATLNLDGEPESPQTGLNNWICRGPFVITLEYLVDDELTDREAKLQLLNNVGVIQKEMQALANTSGYLSITNTRLVRFGLSDPADDQGSVLAFAEIVVEYRGQF
jgi:hypothetical protein